MTDYHDLKRRITLCEQVAILIKAGHTRKEICDVLGIARSRFYVLRYRAVQRGLIEPQTKEKELPWRHNTLPGDVSQWHEKSPWPDMLFEDATVAPEPVKTYRPEPVCSWSSMGGKWI